MFWTSEITCLLSSNNILASQNQRINLAPLPESLFVPKTAKNKYNYGSQVMFGVIECPLLSG